MSDDLNDDDLSIDDSFDDFEKKENTLGDMWKDNPFVKIGVIAVGIVIFFVIVSFLSGGDGDVQDSFVGAAPDVTSTPGSNEATPASVQAIKELNEADIERAFNQGDSSLPVPIEPPIGIVSLPAENEVVEDPLQRWRRLQEERLQREIRQQQGAPKGNAANDKARAEAIQQMAESMAQQMTSVLESQSRTRVSSLVITSPDFLANLAEEEMLVAASSGVGGEGEFDGEEFVGEQLLPAGEIYYATLLTEANSDSPAPVLAEIVSGPLKGNRILGTFETQKEYLTLNFDTVVYEENSLSIDAVALNPETTLPGIATDVDHHYLQRIVLPAAAAFVEGMAGAIADSGLTSVTVEGEVVAEEEEETSNDQEVATGIQEAGDAITEIIDEINEDLETTIIVAAGTPIGILFLEPVINDAPPVNEPLEGQ